MKIGTENRKETIAALVLLAVAALLLVRTFSSPAVTPVKTSAHQTAPQPAATEHPQGVQKKILSASLKPTLDPRLRLDLLKSSEDIKYEGTGRNIFSLESEPVIPKAVVSPVVQPAVQQGPPPPPPINVKFFGYATRTGEPKSIFLVQGDNVFTAHVGDIVAGRYKIVRINPTSVEIQDVLSNNTQTIPLMQG